MAAFDPDAFLSGTAQTPEEKKKRGGFDPDAYLSAPQTQPAAAPLPTAQTVLGGTESSARKVASRAALADTAINALTGTFDWAARIPATAYEYATGPKGETFGQAYERAAKQVGQAIKPDIVGRTLGITGTREYENAPTRYIGREFVEPAITPVIQAGAEATGLPPGAVADIAGIAAIPAGPVIGRVAAPVGRAVKSAAQVPVDVAKGALGRATGYIAKPGETPTGYQVPSSRIPMGETFIPAKEMAELQRGMPISEGAVRPISELAPTPVLALSGGEIPVAGRAAQAYGERLGETYRNPLTAAADIGSMFLTGGIPVLTAGRGALGLAQAGADAYLARKGFTSLTPEQTAVLNAGGNPFYTAAPIVPKAQPAAPAPVVTTQPVVPTTITPTTVTPTTTARPTQFTPDVARIYQNAKNTLGAQGFARADFEAVAASNLADDLIRNAKDNGIKLPRKDALAQAQRQIEAHGNELRNAELQAQQQAFETSPAGQATIKSLAEAEARQAAEAQAAAEIQAAAAANAEATKQAIRNKITGEVTPIEPTPLPTETVAPAPVVEPVKKRMSQEERIRQREAGMTAEELAAQEAEVARNLKKTKQNNPLQRALGKETPTVTGETLPTSKYKNAAEMRKDLYGKMPNDKLEALVDKTFPSPKNLKEKMTSTKTESTAEGNEALRQRLEAIIKAQKKNKPAGTMEMATEQPTIMNKAEWDQLNFQNTLAEKPTLEPYIDGNKLVTHELEKVGPFESIIRTEYDVNTSKQLAPGKRISMKKVK